MRRLITIMVIVLVGIIDVMPARAGGPIGAGWLRQYGYDCDWGTYIYSGLGGPGWLRQYGYGRGNILSPYYFDRHDYDRHDYGFRGNRTIRDIAAGTNIGLRVLGTFNAIETNNQIVAMAKERQDAEIAMAQKEQAFRFEQAREPVLVRRGPIIIQVNKVPDTQEVQENSKLREEIQAKQQLLREIQERQALEQQLADINKELQKSKK